MLDEQDDQTTVSTHDSASDAAAADDAAAGSTGRPPRRRRAAVRAAGPPAAVAFTEVQAPAPASPTDSGPPAAAVVAAPLFQAPTLPKTATPPVPESVEAADEPPAAASGEAGKRGKKRGGKGRSEPENRGSEDREPAQGDEQQRDAKGAPADGGGASRDSSDTPERAAEPAAGAAEAAESGEEGGSRRRRRRRRRVDDGDGAQSRDDADRGGDAAKDEVAAVKGSTRMEAKKQRRREGRESGRRRAPIVSEAEFLARRESVRRSMVVRQRGSLTQIAVMEDGVLVEHYVNQATATSLVGNVYLGRVQNVLPSMEAAFVDIGRGRNAVLYAGEVNWDAAGLEGQPKRIEQALSAGDKVLVQVTKDPVGHKGARLTSQVSLPGRFLVLVPDGSMTGISRKLPDRERARLRGILRAIVPEGAGVIVRTAAEGASEEDLTRDVEHLTAAWDRIQAKAQKSSPATLLHAEPDLALRIVRDIFNADFESLVVSGGSVADQLVDYVRENAPALSERVQRWTSDGDAFAEQRIDEQLAKALDRKVYLPSGGSLVIDRTEAMTVVDVNTGRFTGQGGNLEETVTRNNLEAAEEIVRQIRLRDVGGIIVIDFIDMVLESNRDLVLRRLVECLGRDRTKHQVAEVTSLGLVQMTRKRIGQGLLETFSEPCECCAGRGVKVNTEPVERRDRERRPPRSVRPPGAHDPVEAARPRASAEDVPVEQPTDPADDPAGPDQARAADTPDPDGQVGAV
jgi:ribonuclease E